MTEPVASSGQPSSGKPPSSPMHILVVDDNEDNRNLLARRLKGKGYIVDIAVDGPSALEACAKTTYDAILLDVMMPGMSGIEVLTKLRETHAKTELAVIMATAKNDSTSVVDALKKGANDYVTKPIDFPVLLARLETHLAMKAETAKVAAEAKTKVDVTFGIAPGTVLADRYEILEKCGEGGFAVVYRARQLSTNREVALKHLRPDVLVAQNDSVHIERFERESKLIGELNHSHVVRLIDSGSVSVRPGAPPAKKDPSDPGATETRKRKPEGVAMSVPYIVMELLQGESLSELIEREAPLDPARSVDIILPVLSALHAAHVKGVVHRDVKPSNIMLTTDARGAVEPKVLDFGIAKLTKQEDSDLTVTSSLVGTPRYMPPEQAFGKKDLDARVDQFSAAAVLYQMLTGRPLYNGENYLELVSNVLAGTYKPLAEAKPGLDPDLVAAVTRALSGQRENRYSTMLAFGRALLPFASDRGGRRWTDEFTTGSIRPPAAIGAVTEPSQPTAIAGSAPPADVTVAHSRRPSTPPKKEELPTKPEGKKSELLGNLEPLPISSPKASSEPPAVKAKSEPPPPPKSEPPPSVSEPPSSSQEDEAPLSAMGQPAPVEVAGPKWGLIAIVALATLIISYLLARYLR